MKGMKKLLDDETQQAVRPLTRADLVNRMLTAENNVLELLLQVNENVKDINILYRSLRRNAGPHPEEPASSRPRTIDRRPAEPEPDGERGSPRSEPERERAFNETASRSRDSEDDREQIDLQEDASLDEVRSDMVEPECYHRRMRNRLHIMNIESNNMEVYLYTMVQQHGPDYVVPVVPWPDILQLYEEHAPSMDAPGEYRAHEQMLHQQFADGSWGFILIEDSEEFGENEHPFVSQMGLYGFRNRRIIARENEGLTQREVEDKSTKQAETVQPLSTPHRLRLYNTQTGDNIQSKLKFSALVHGPLQHTEQTEIFCTCPWSMVHYNIQSKLKFSALVHGPLQHACTVGAPFRPKQIKRLPLEYKIV